MIGRGTLRYSGVTREEAMEYRKSITHSTETDYWHVDMGPRDHLNGPGSYPFPTVEAATRFAQSHKARDPHRDIVIRYPDGRCWNGKEWT
ncbi:hypothetical protein PBI_RHYNO_66 [Mycobacterium phage RhynO]|uniref:hypothetical protein n=1 Tax=Mycobacterium phage RhynO TaxID=1458846 RepID=UPI0003F1D226|nr:hypothetical protein CG97_gp16 [Mycobacterium phage RhynO]AHJ88724.1 hypothetical protein PBI_RHYNO_66 [Mycobacterium phage RhynO]